MFYVNKVTEENMGPILGRSNEVTTVNIRDMIYNSDKSNVKIEQLLEISAYAFYNIFDYQVKNLLPQGFRYILIEFSRTAFNDDTDEVRIPLSYCLFAINTEDPAIDSMFLIGIWNSVYGLIRYNLNNTTFPIGIGLRMFDYAVRYMNDVYNQNGQINYIILDALLGTRTMLTRTGGPPIPLYRYPNIRQIYKYQMEDDEGYPSIVNENNERPSETSQLIALSPEFKSYNYILLRDALAAQTPQPCIQCDIQPALFTCGACMTAVYCSGACQREHWKSEHIYLCCDSNTIM
jgi:hypothetical protein